MSPRFPHTEAKLVCQFELLRFVGRLYEKYITFARNRRTSVPHARMRPALDASILLDFCVTFFGCNKISKRHSLQPISHSYLYSKQIYLKIVTKWQHRFIPREF